jgi:2-methylcitrate dehydratase PrpD
MTQGLGEKYYILETEFKVHPSIGWVHPVHSRLKELVEEHDIQPDDIKHINVKGMQAIRLDDYSPAGAVDAQFSLPYTVVSTVLRDPLTPAMYDEERIHSPEVQALLKKVTIEPDAEADLQFFEHQRLIFEITVTLNNGKNINSRVVWPEEKPPFGEKEVKSKFNRLASLILPENRVSELMDTVMDLENIDDVGILSKMMC